MITIVAIVLNSCKEDPPVCDFTYVATGLSVAFTSTATNSSTYSWEFGDGETSTDMNPVHVYGIGGSYEVKLSVTGEGGSDYKRETITVVVTAADIKNMLTGGAGAANGKTWVLKTTVTAGDGASAVEPSMVVLIPVPADFFGWLGREKDAGRKEEFTFKYDGSYRADAKNDTVVAISLFAALNAINVPNTNSPYGTCRAKYIPPATGGTWTLNETNFVVDAITNPAEQNIPPAHGNVTFTGKSWLHFSTGSYLGFLDYTTSSRVIIKSISTNELKVALIVCMYAAAGHPSGTGLPYAQLPTHIYHMSFIPK